MVNLDDLGLRYGSFIDGEWNIVGVIGIMDEIRKAAGRPHQAYGITPLVIYRTVTRHG